MDLFSYQKDGVEFLSKNNCAVLADSPGLGKTVQAIRAADKDGATSILVVCPAVVRAVWQREFEQQQIITRTIDIASTGKAFKTGLQSDVVIISYDLASQNMVHSQLLEKKWDLIILDEAHFLKSKTAVRAKRILLGKSALVKTAKKVFALTGTPTPNHLGELWTLLYALFPQTIPRPGHDKPMRYWEFVDRYCKTTETPFGVKIVGNNAATLPELQSAIAPYFLRRRKEDVLCDLPPIRFEDLPVRAADSDVKHLEKKLGRQEVEELLVALETGQSLPVMGEHIAALRRFTELAKVGPCIDLLTDELESDPTRKIAVFGQHIDALGALVAGLEKFKPALIRGDVTATNRRLAIDAFTTVPDCRVFIGQHAAAGIGLTLHGGGACSDVVFLSCSWTPADNYQAAMRVHRIGQQNSVLVRFLSLVDSLDEHVTRTLKAKTRDISDIWKGEAAMQKINLRQTIDDLIRLEKSEFMTQNGKILDRTTVLNSSEAWTCERRLVFEKLGYSPDPDYEHTWGYFERGHGVEDWAVDAIIAALPEGVDLIDAGRFQRTLVDGEVSATPDGLLVNRSDETFMIHGVEVPPGGCVVLEFKSHDPRSNIRGPKPPHVLQTKIQMGLFHEKTAHRPEHAIILYINASDWSKMQAFVVKRDPKIIDQVRTLAKRILSAASPLEVTGDGAHSGQCKYCPFVKQCSDAVIEGIPEHIDDVSEVASREAALLASRHGQLAKTIKANTAEKMAIEDQIKTVLRREHTRRITGDFFTITYDKISGRTSLDKAALEAAGINLGEFEKVGRTSERLVIKVC